MQSIICWTVTPAGVVFLKQALQLGIDKMNLIHSYGFVSQHYMELAGDAAKNRCCCRSNFPSATQLPDSDPQKASILAMSKSSRPSSSASPTSLPRKTYDAINLASTAVAKAGGTDKAKVRDALDRRDQLARRRRRVHVQQGEALGTVEVRHRARQLARWRLPPRRLQVIAVRHRTERQTLSAKCHDRRRDDVVPTMLDIPEAGFRSGLGSREPAHPRSVPRRDAAAVESADRHRLGQAASRAIQRGAARRPRACTGAGAPGANTARSRKARRCRSAFATSVARPTWRCSSPSARRKNRGTPRSAIAWPRRLGGYFEQPAAAAYQGSVATHGIRKLALDPEFSLEGTIAALVCAAEEIAFDVFRTSSKSPPTRSRARSLG